MQKYDGSGCAERDQDCAGNSLRKSQAKNHERNRKVGHGGRRHRKGVPRLPKGHHAVKEITGNVIHLQTEEVTDLRAGDQDRDAVGEANDNRPGIPCLAMIPATTTTNAPVGPPICVFEPPKAEIRKPVTMAQYRPACGETPDAMAKAIASGSATSPTVTPAIKSETNLWRL